MKSFFFVILTLTVFNIQAQIVKPYIAIVKTQHGRETGILRQVTSDALILERGDSLAVIKAVDIHKITIKASKKPYQYNSFFSYKPWDESNFETPQNGQARIRKYGEKDPTYEEEVKNHMNTAVMNGAINLVAAPFSSINGSIDKMTVNYKLETFITHKDNLVSYSVYYQKNPDYNAELKKIKAVNDQLKGSSAGDIQKNH